MKITVEISMYPFQENYRDLIRNFVSKLNQHENISVATGPTSTVVIGDYTHVMETITEMIRWSYEEHGRAVFVTKFIPGYVPD